MSDEPRATVLVVDDEDDVRAVIVAALKDSGFDTIEASTGTGALELVSQHLAAVVLDVRLPDLSGIEVCRRIRASALTSSLPVLLVSGFLMTEEDRAIGLSSGADLYLTKPLSLSGLALAVDTLLRLRRAADEAHLGLAHARLLVGQLSGAVDLDDVLGRVSQVAQSLLRADVVRIRLLDPAGGPLRLVSSIGTWTPGANAIGSGLSAVVVRERRTVCVEDALADPRVVGVEQLAVEGVSSVLEAPLMLGDEPLGVLVCWSRPRRAWSAEDVTRAETIAAHAAGAIRNARLFAENERRRRLAESLAEVSLLMSRSLDPTEVGARVVESVRRLLAADDVGLYRLEEATGDLVLTNGADAVGWMRRLRKGEGLNGLAVQQRRPVTTTDLLGDPRVTLSAGHREWLETVGSRAVLAVPLLVRDRVIATVSATASVNRAFTADDISVAAALASHAAIALENSRLFDESERRRREAESLADVGRLVSQSLDVAEVGTRILDSLHRLVHADTAALYVRADEAGTLRLACMTPTVTWNPVMRPGDGASGLAVRERRPVVTLDVLTDPRITLPDDARTRMEGLRLQAALAVPLVVQDQVIGALVLIGKAGRVFTTEEVELATAFASHAAIALENSRLFAERLAVQVQLEARERKQSAIARLAQRAVAAEDAQMVLAEAAAIVAETLGVDAVAILKLSPDGTTLSPAGRFGALAEPLDADATRASEPGRALAGAGPVVFDVATSGRSVLPPEVIADRGIVSGMEVGIEGFIPPFGVLGAYCGAARRFSDDAVTFLGAAASVLGTALVRIHTESALRRHAGRLRVMREIAEAILAAHSSREVADAALAHLGKLVPYWRASVQLFSFEDSTALVFAAVGAGDDVLPGGIRHPLAHVGQRDLDELVAGRVPIGLDAGPEHPSVLVRALVAFGLRSYFRVPLLVRGDLLGCVTVSFDRPHAFSGDDVDIVREVAEPLALALEQARLHESVVSSRTRLQSLSRRMIEIQEEERAHLARELHDEIGQLLTGLKLSLETLARGAAGRPGGELVTAQHQVTDLMGRVRALSIDLRPAALEDLGLVAALSALVQRYETQTRIRVALKERGVQDRRFPREVESAAYRIIQEALTNVARHAGVDHATVRIWADREQLGLQVDDRGAGFDHAGAAGTGLTGMRERAALLGARFDIESAPGTGTCITAEFPLETQ